MAAESIRSGSEAEEFQQYLHDKNKTIFFLIASRSMRDDPWPGGGTCAPCIGIMES